jgi:hypothetical protein
MKVTLGFIALIFALPLAILQIPPLKLPDAVEMDCLVKTVYHEARGESEQGQLAVARVILNRVASGHYPNSICGVILQDKQFSGMSFERLWKKLPPEDARRIQARVEYYVAGAVFGGLYPGHGRCEKLDLIGAMYYHNLTVKPAWSKKMKKITKIGNHVFYAEKI